MFRARMFRARFFAARVLSATGTPPAPPNPLAGIIIAWPGTVASIPAGWTRVTALDGRYPKMVAAAAEPGATGGALTHTHTSPAHDHTTAHTHTTPNSGAGSGQSARDSAATNPLVTHTHDSNPAAPNPTTTLANETPAVSTVSHEPPFFEVLFLLGDGTTAGLPAQSLAFWADDTGLPSGLEPL